MNRFTITLVYADGDFECETHIVETDRSELDMHYLVAESFFCESGGSSATIVKPNVWSITMANAVFIVELDRV